MRGLSVQSVLQRLLEIVVRDTGKALSSSAEAELATVLDELATSTVPVPQTAGLDRLSHSKIGQEFLSREVTILFADLRGFTAMVANQPAGIVIKILNPCLIKMSEIIFKHQGTIDKFMGDSIMVLFGAPVQRPDDVQRALACAVEMQITMDAINLEHKEQGMPELYMGIGINTGEVLAGTLGSDLYSEYTVIGDEVNLASRIEAFSLRGQVLIGHSTFERSEGFIETGDPIDIYVKGKSLPVSLREVLGIPSLDLKVPRKEVRRSHRIEVKQPFEFQVIDNGVVMPEVHRGTILDISYHGALLQLERELPIYTEIKLSFDLPMVDYQARDIYTKILKRIPTGEGVRMGSEFTSIPPEANMKIQLFVQLLVFSDQT